MTENYLRLADRIHRELGNIETALHPSFRHVVRYIYPFDLEASPIKQLVELADPTFARVR